jgi:enoyl-CoA hydratase/carnithine racemase
MRPVRAGNRKEEIVALVEYEQRGHVAVITLNRPERRNAFHTPMALEMEAAVDRVEGDDEIRVAVLRANTTEPRPVFCAGYDLTSGTGDAHGGYTDRGGFAGFTQRARTKPIVVAVDGFAVGGGFEIALACDVVVASPRAAFALAEVKWNLVAAAGGITRLPRMIGRIAAMDVVLTGTPLTAERAYQLGLVSRLASDGDVEGLALVVAGEIAANGPFAVRLARGGVLAAETLDEDAAWAMNDRLIAEINSSEDREEGVQAFLEKRSPQWTGR